MKTTVKSKLTNQFKQWFSIALIAFSTMATSNAFAWGQNGHRIVGKIADEQLTATTRAALQELLAGDKLAEVTTWADEMRSSPEEFWRKKSSKWHYISLDKLEDFNPHDYHDKATNIYTAMRKSIDVLKDPKASNKDKQFYLRFLTHLVGDVHQPLHVGRADDRGGNSVKVEFFGEQTNLHSVWDTKLVEYQSLSYTEFADFIITDDKKIISEYLNSSMEDWIKESFDLREQVYDIGDGEFKYGFIYKNTPTVKKRLLQAGIRLGGLLNQIFDPKAKPLVNALKK
ncbi:S1/P1 nuclease [Flocculibacter collagenilyticus]|uniref:S1/P1 nuclease n=1 Tax=Flocculibacter collagenilyticus TaxID=2744479 RepID=UPI0018F6B44D|nr:S1/P1 nuclease [Flocculibacter collagenilyticus]